MMTPEELAKAASNHALQTALLDAYIEDECGDIDTELDRVVDMLRRDSAHELLCGRDAERRLIDNIIARLERHEHR